VRRGCVLAQGHGPLGLGVVLERVAGVGGLGRAELLEGAAAVRRKRLRSVREAEPVGARRFGKG